MGYRLYISDNQTDDEICLGKLFGYVSFDKHLRAFKFLELIGKLQMPEDEFAFVSGGSMDIVLTKKQTEVFADLYTLDFQQEYKNEQPFFYDDLKQFIKNHSGNFTLKWS